MRSVADLTRMAERAGCRLVRTRQVGGELVGEFSCPDIIEGRPLQTARLLDLLTEDDAAADPVDPAIVLAVKSAGNLAPLAALLYVQHHVRFVEDEYEGEPVEKFQTPTATIREGEGDCDDSARLLRAIARAAGIPSRYVFWLMYDQPAHVTTQLYSGGAWRWAEASIAARYGEHPFAALRRLNGKRPDLDGAPFLLVNGQLVPLTPPKPKPVRGSPTMNLSSLARRAPSPRRWSLGALVPRVGTPVTGQSLANALAAAWPSAIGGSPGSAIQVLVAQSAFETGNWAAMWNWNIGNVKTSTNGSTDYFSMSATEGSGSNVTMQSALWRSYPDLESGAAGYLTFLNNNYNAALQSAIAGDVPGFVSALKSRGYFTGDLGQYTSGVQQYYARYGGLSPSAVAGTAVAAAQAATSIVTGEDSEDQSATGPTTPQAVAGIAAGTLLGVILGFLV